MKWVSNYKAEEGHRYEIELDESVGYYFYAWGGSLEPYDSLQDTLYFSKDDALEDFGVPIDSWTQVE